MKPSNNKSVFAIVCDNLGAIQDSEKTSIGKCEAIVKLTNAALNIQFYEIKKAKAQMEIETYNKTFGKVELRNVESKAFDSI